VEIFCIGGWLKVWPEEPTGRKVGALEQGGSNFAADYKGMKKHAEVV
jgi:hypothetical protein